MQDLIKQVKVTRSAQNTYFRNKTKASLMRAFEEEKKLDNMVIEMEANA